MNAVPLMSRAQHRKRAEQLLAMATVRDPGANPVDVQILLSSAHVHATLAAIPDLDELLVDDEDLREAWGENELDHDRVPTNAGYQEWLRSQGGAS